MLVSCIKFLVVHSHGARHWECKIIPGLKEAMGNCVFQCSSTCAGGFQRRVVVCQDENGYTANNCDEKSKPMEQRSCESGPCPQWAYGNWGEVSAPFIPGSLHRGRLSLAGG